MLKQILPAVRATLILAVCTGLLFPLLITGLAQALFREQANGSLVRADDGRVVGSRLIGQPFTRPEYFHPRPSAAGSGYSGIASGGTNLGPTSAKLLAGVDDLAVQYRTVNRLPAGARVPVDAVTRSASGLDPHISPPNAALQVDRVARARGLPRERVEDLVCRHTKGRDLGVLGEPRVNVLLLNLALDRETRGKPALTFLEQHDAKSAP